MKLPASLAIAALLAVGAGVLSAGSHASSGAVSPKRGKVLFVAMCGSCHTLAAAKTHGKVGGNLADDDRSAAEVAARIRRGGDGMPAFAKTLKPLQIRDIAAFVAASTQGHGRDD